MNHSDLWKRRVYPVLGLKGGLGLGVLKGLFVSLPYLTTFLVIHSDFRPSGSFQAEKSNHSGHEFLTMKNQVGPVDPVCSEKVNERTDVAGGFWPGNLLRTPQKGFLLTKTRGISEVFWKKNRFFSIFIGTVRA